MKSTPLPEKWLRPKNTLDTAFLVSLTLKALNSLGELLTGLGLLFISAASISHWSFLLVQPELTEDPKDLIANYILKATQDISLGTKDFLILYLLSHGIIKLALICAIVLKKTWAYPLMMVFLGAFAIYSLYKFSHVGGLYLLIFALFDIFIVILTYFEYKRLRKKSEM